MTVNFNNKCLINPAAIDDIRDINHPAFFQVIYAPLDVQQTISKIARLKTKLDFEESVDIALRLNRAPLSFFYTSLSTFALITHFIYKIKLNPILSKISRIVPLVLGVFIGVAETISEVIWLKRIISFNNNLSSSPSYNIKFIQKKYCELQRCEKLAITQKIKSSYPKLNKKQYTHKMHEQCKKALQIKQANLARRLSPWLAREAIEKIPNILKNLNSSKGKKAARELLSNIQIQLDKRLIIHFVGLIALAFLFTGISLTFAGAPLLPIIIIFCFETLFGYMRYYLAAGWLESRDWQFQMEKCLPLFVQNWREKQRARAEFLALL